jgi:phosphoribulokinase
MGSVKDRLDSLDAYVVVGIGGDSGSGKTTFSQGIRSLLGQDLVSGFSMDDYHSEDRATRKVTGNLPLDPAYNKLELLAEHLAQLRQGKEIIKPVYNHSTGEFDPEVLFKPTRIMIIEGLHPFYTQALRDQMDFSIFVDPIRDVKWKWKLQRDVEKRGHEQKAAFAEILEREPLFMQYIDVQKIWSEVVIRVIPSRYSDDELERPQVKLKMRHTDIPVHQIDMAFDMSQFITSSERYFSLEFGSDYFYGHKFNVLTIDGLLSKRNVSKLQDQIRDFTGLADNVLFDDDMEEFINPSGVAQLIIAWRFLEKLSFILNELDNAVE